MKLYVKKIMKRGFLLLICFISIIRLLAQVTDGKTNPIPQTPNVASLFKEVEVPVSYYNGTIDPGIPIYEIKSGSVKIPIALGYHSGGIKVNEEASWVGLGWNLKAGGVITQVIVGKEDNLELTNYVDYMKHNISPNRGTGRNNDPVNVIERGTCFPDANGVMHDFSIYSNVGTLNGGPSYMYLGSSDRQFDLIMYNFGNYSGKLINPKVNYYEDKLVSLDNNNIKFIQSSPFFNVGDFKAITPDGTVYLFNNIESTVIYDNGTNTWSYSRYLTSITSPEGEVVNFSYKTVTSYLLPGASHSYSTSIIEPSSSQENFSPYLSWNENKSISPVPVVQALYMDEITWNGGKVKFVSDNNRDDISAGYKLNSIEVYDKSNLLVKKVDFSYDYFVGLSKYGDYFQNGNFASTPDGLRGMINESARKKRLKLLSVKFDDMPPYSFEYNPGDMPYKTAFAKDIWDYFNGVNFDQIYDANKYSLLPDPSDVGYYDASIMPWVSVLPGSHFGQRHPNENAMQSGLLQKIIYPTGGYSSFEYEANRFLTPDNTSSAIGFTGYAAAIDGNRTEDVKQVEFTIPTINSATSYNSGRIDIRLSCGCTTVSGTTACMTYSAAGSANNLLGYGLFATLEIWNGTSWITLRTWDYANSDIVSRNGILTINYDFVQGSKYRITANYPDRAECAGDYYGKRVASISASFYDFQSNTNSYCIGAGVRIKKITDYTKPNLIGNSKKFSYEDGILMTKPNFIRIVSNLPFTYRAKDCFTTATDPCHGCDEIGQNVNVSFAPGSTIPIDGRYSSGYFSEPVIPYSYGANGSLIGYSKVTEEYEGQKQSGKSVYEYNNHKDYILSEQEAMFFPHYRPNMLIELSRLPGLPTIKDPLNGQMKTKTVYSRTQTSYKPIQKTSFEYRLDNSRTFWGYKTDVKSSGYSSVAFAGIFMPQCNLGSVDYSNCIEIPSTFLWFYPVTCSNVNLISKKDELFDVSKEIETTSSYYYNSKNQLQKEIKSDSKGSVISQETYYVADRQSEGAVLQEMQNRNMIDYPVEVIKNDITGTTRELNRIKTNYQFWNGTSIILPGSQQSSNYGNTLVDEVVFNSYDSKGNLLQFTSKDNIPTSFIWGYNQTYPIAKIIGASYSQVLAALSQSDQNLGYLQNMSDNSLETEMSLLRNNIKALVPAAQVNTYLYKPLVGMTQATDLNGKKTFYEYDSFNRVKLIKDQNGNIVKTFEYQYYQ